MGATRGTGLLEGFLAKRRSAQVRKLLRRSRADGPILDIGCGAVPTFLLGVPFEQRVGLERFVPTVPADSPIELVLGDAAEAPHLPFESGSFGTVTMLAVLEHLPEAELARIINEIFRVLEPNGTFILTTPAKGTGALLRILAKVGLVSSVEIGEHQPLMARAELRGLLQSSPFGNDSVRVGSFELYMNNWVVAHKASVSTEVLA